MANDVIPFKDVPKWLEENISSCVPCDHILGKEGYDSVYDHWLVQQSNGWGDETERFLEFTFCPLCGERLNK